MSRRCAWMLILTLAVMSPALAADDPPARGPGRGAGGGAALRTDRDVFHFLLKHHDQVRRTVKRTPNGVETLTESDTPEVAAKIQEHVAAMQRRMEQGQGLRFWDPLFAALFDRHAAVEMSVEQTDTGVRVKETSGDPRVVTLIQAHAEVVSQFVARGFDEAHVQHAVPAAPARKLSFPIIAKYGGVVERPQAAEQPRAGAKVVLDVTTDSPPAEVNKGIERAARLLNLYGVAGLKASDIQIVIVLHGEATKTVLHDAAFHDRYGVESNPNLPLVRELKKAGVEVFVCGQALGNKGFADAEVAEEIPLAVSALTLLSNRQADGYTAIAVP